MYFLFFIAGFLLIRRLRMPVKNSPVFTKWRSLFSFSSWAVVALFFVVTKFTDDEGSLIISSALLLSLVVYLQKEPDFNYFSPYIQACYPLVVAGFLNSFVQLIVPAFYDRWENYFDFAVVGAFIWIFAKWANSKKQQQELQIIGDQKAELEVLVAKRTAELKHQKEALLKTVKELKAIQTQLIQQEKLASLGELTAGITHEI